MIGKIEPGTQKSYDEVAPQVKKRDRRKPRQEPDRQPARQDRGRARRRSDARRDRQETGAQGRHHRRRRPLRAAARTAPSSPICRSSRTSPPPLSPAMSASTTTRCKLPDGGWLWYDVTGITPSRERSLDEVKDQVAARWREDEIAKILHGQGRRHARQAQDRIDAGAARGRSRPQGRDRGRPATRQADRGRCRRRLSQAVFNAAKGASGAAEGAKADQRVVFTVTDIVDPQLDPNAPDTQRLEATLQNSYADDMLGEYLARAGKRTRRHLQPDRAQPGHRRRHA